MAETNKDGSTVVWSKVGNAINAALDVMQSRLETLKNAPGESAAQEAQTIALTVVRVAETLRNIER
jgi:hypothetical protein